ncbi:MAG: hypothetical protein V3U58_02625 [Thermodesulfobacteriota bacterium]
MEKLFTHQKAQAGISDLGSFAIALLIGAVILGLGGTILDKIKTTQTDKTATLPLNESLTWAGNNTAISFAQESVKTDTVKVYNNGTIMLQSGNYTFSGNSIIITNQSLLWNGSNASENSNIPNLLVTENLNASYSYSFGSSAKNTTEFGLTGVGTMAEFIPTIAIVAVAAIVIGVILIFFGRRRMEVKL